MAGSRRAERVLLTLAAGATAVVLAVASGGAGRSAFAGRDARRPVPQAASAILTLAIEPTVTVPGTPPSLPWPSTGEAAAAVAGVGLVGTSGSASSVPIASVTKVMTAYVVLRDHPLTGDEGGPRLRMTEADNLAYQRAAAAGDSNLEVVAGEVLDERQLLEALLVPSADNVADLLARWDAGSARAFVAKMNATAAALGMTRTHYADASGVSPGSVSTAADQLLLAAAAMRVPALASIVDRPAVVLPVAGEVENYNPLLGSDGVVGLKSGFTEAAQACLVVAAWREVDGRRALVLVDAFGQPGGLAGAAAADRALLDAFGPHLEVVTLLRGGTVVGVLHVPERNRRDTLLPVRLAAPLTVLAWSGLRLRLGLASPAAAPPAGTGWPSGAPDAAPATNGARPGGDAISLRIPLGLLRTRVVADLVVLGEGSLLRRVPLEVGPAALTARRGR
jgi:D-alanyl-D-alanine carboxypeptidase (penicillin-binding protein 5/6)